MVVLSSNPWGTGGGPEPASCCATTGNRSASGPTSLFQRAPPRLPYMLYVANGRAGSSGAAAACGAATATAPAAVSNKAARDAHRRLLHPGNLRSVELMLGCFLSVGFFFELPSHRSDRGFSDNLSSVAGHWSLDLGGVTRVRRPVAVS